MKRADYDSIAEDWRKARTQLPARDAALFDYFSERLPPASRVLDLGCGNGMPVTGLLSGRGFDVTGVDYSVKLLEQARAHFPALTFERGDLASYEIEGEFSGVVLWDVLFHLSREEHERILNRIHDALTSNGLLILSSGGSEHHIPPFTDCMFGVEFHYDSHPIGDFLSLCKRTGYSILKRELLNAPDGGRDKGRMGAVLSRS